MNDCGCEGFYPFPAARCGSYNQPAGPYPCRPYFVAVKKNFTIPAVDQEVLVELTGTETLYEGEGIRIGDGYYKIEEIVDSTKVNLKHNGVGVTPGNLVIAVHPSYGCYQYQVIPVGKVTLDSTPTLVGLNQARTTPIASSIINVDVNKLVYGRTGKTTVEIQAEVIADIANTPYFLGIALPAPARTTAPHASFSALLDNGAGLITAAAYLGSGSYADYVVIGAALGPSNTLSNGTDRRFIVSGSYEVEI